MPKQVQREIIELSATVAVGATDTRVSAAIPYPFIIRQIEIHNTATLQTDFTLRVGTTDNEAGSIATDTTFRDLRSNRSSKENERYPNSVPRIFPNLVRDSQNLRFKAEAINATGVVHDFFIAIIIEEWKNEPKEY